MLTQVTQTQVLGGGAGRGEDELVNKESWDK